MHVCDCLPLLTHRTLIKGLGDQLGGIVEEIKGKIFGKPEVTEHGRERRTGELMRKERERVSRVHLLVSKD